MREQNKTERKKRSKEIRELEAERRFEQKKLKHKEKTQGTLIPAEPIYTSAPLFKKGEKK